MQDEEDLDGFRSDDESLFSIKQFIFLLEQFILFYAVIKLYDVSISSRRLILEYETNIGINWSNIFTVISGITLGIDLHKLVLQISLN